MSKALGLLAEIRAMVKAERASAPIIAILPVLATLDKLETEIRPEPVRGVPSATLAVDLVARLNEFRKQIETSWPDNCCAKGIMRENNGRETVGCLDSCPWNAMELTIANALVDAEILARRLGEPPSV